MQELTSPPTPRDELEEAGCRHHWVIEPAIGLVSKGICRYCAEVREFMNYVEENDWMEDEVIAPLED